MKKIKEAIELIEEQMKWLKDNYHTHYSMKKEYQKWFDYKAENRYYELECDLKYYKKHDALAVIDETEKKQ
jgi:hypothetical protein